MVHQFTLALVRGGRALYLQIAAGLTSEIERGRLRSGDRLPSSRGLAEQLDVHRKTVVAAYHELERQGWIERRARSGVFVSTAIPVIERVRSVHRVPARPGFDWARWALPRRPTSQRARYDLLGGVPELGAATTTALARAYRRALALDRSHKLIDYGDPRGDPRLREALASWLASTRGLRATSDGLAVVRGAQHGMYLAARALLAPGDRVAIEAYAHPAISSLLRLVGAELVPVPVDDEGLRVDELERLCRAGRIRAVYTTPHHQLPTTVTLSAGRRLRLLALARRERMMILEDGYDHEFRYEGQPVLPLAYLDRDGVVVYFGTLSKVVAPGLRVAFVVAAPTSAQPIPFTRSGAFVYAQRVDPATFLSPLAVFDERGARTFSDDLGLSCAPAAGSLVVFNDHTNDTFTGADLRVVDVDADVLAPRTIWEQAAISFVVSEDGRRVVFASGPGDTKPGLYAHTLPGRDD